MEEKVSSKRYWNAAARDNAAWYIATGFTDESDEFFASGAREVDLYLQFAGVTLDATQTVLEIGCGAGRMTRRLAQLAGRVIAVDVSGEMLARARANLAASDTASADGSSTGTASAGTASIGTASIGTVEFVEVSGDGDLPGADASVDAVFSYITMQHVPTAAGQERYFAEALRVVRPGGWVLMQFRQAGLIPRALDWAGHIRHSLSGRRTFSREWRGARVKMSVLRSYARDGVVVDIRPLGRRHVWAIARRQA